MSLSIVRDGWGRVQMEEGGRPEASRSMIVRTSGSEREGRLSFHTTSTSRLRS